MNFPIRYVAQIIVEAETPLAIGSDSLLFDQDAPVEKDCNGLPYIPGTAIAGFLRHKLKGLSDLFGEEPDSNSDQPVGSNFITSDAYLLDSNYKVHQKPEIISDEFLLRYDNLPIRQHVAINVFGAKENVSLFDQEIVFKGSRFKFEIELQLKVNKDANWKTILNAFFDNDFYIGGGQFNNFGELKVIGIIKQKCFDLKNDLDAYLKLSADLNTAFNGNIHKNESIEKSFKEEPITLSGKDSFFHFGAGFGDTEVDNINYRENIVVWDKTNNPSWETNFVIPGTSIKGALAHRVAYHFNKTYDCTIEKLLKELPETMEFQFNKTIDLVNIELGDTLEALEKQQKEIEDAIATIDKQKLKVANSLKKHTGINNEAVQSYFGSAKSDTGNGKAGTVIFKDVYLSGDTKETIFYHNKIDRYTSGTIGSALFSEKVLVLNNLQLIIKSKEKITEGSCLDLALNDLKKGLLPVGGLVNKGHGIFIAAKTA